MSSSDLADILNDLSLSDSQDVRGPASSQLPRLNANAQPDDEVKVGAEEASANAAKLSPITQKDVGPPSRAQTFQSVPPPASLSPQKKKHPPRYRKTNKSSQFPKAPTKPQKQDSEETQEKASSAYVVLVCIDPDGKEFIVGVFTTLTKANEAANVVAERGGVSKRDIVDIVTSIGDHGGLATRRMWPNGTSEIRINSYRSNIRWIKVFAKEFDFSSVEGGKDVGNAYLALDRLRRAVFVIGVFGTKNEAWEACEKYWTQLSYCDPIQKLEKAFDKEGMLHTKGVIGVVPHHWCVERCGFDPKVG